MTGTLTTIMAPTAIMAVPVAPENWWLWGIVIAAAFPIAVVILGEMAYRLYDKYPAFSHLIRVTRLFVIPIAAALIFSQQVVGYGEQDIIWRLLASAFWIMIIHVALLLMDILLFGTGNADTWRANVPTLLRDIGRIFLVLLGIAFVLASIWSVDLTSLLTALGVGSLVIGLALQDTLKNIFSGIALLAENPMRIGDWVQIDDVKGKVVQTNWRAVHLETEQRDFLVIPNSVLNTKSIRNFSIRPSHVEVVELLFATTDQPNKIAGLVREVALGIHHLVHNEQPTVVVLSHGETGIRYAVSLVCEDYSYAVQARNDFMSRLWYAAQRHGLLLGGDSKDGGRIRRDRSDYVAERLQTIVGFAGIDLEGIQKLAAGSQLLYFGEGEYVLRQGQHNDRLYVILDGSVAVLIEDSHGRYEEVAQLGRGHFMGEITLFKTRTTSAHIRAREDLEVIAVNEDAMLTLLDQVPKLARALSQTVDARLQANLNLTAI
ncbi:MAG: small-conductance mechanosensitive channel [Paraglaciecola sp.]